MIHLMSVAADWSVWHALALVLTVLNLVGVFLVTLWRTEFTTRRTALSVRGVHIIIASGAAFAIVALVFLPWPWGERALAAAVVLSTAQLAAQLVTMRRWPELVASSTVPADFADSHKCPVEARR